MDKILMIKEVRHISGCGLKEAKDAVEEVSAGGGSPELKEMVSRATTKAANRPPRSEEARRSIRHRVKGIKYLAEDIEVKCEGNFDENDLPEIREALEAIINDALTIKDRMIYYLEEILSKEAEGGK